MLENGSTLPKPLIIIPTSSRLDVTLAQSLQRLGFAYLQVTGSSDPPRMRSRMLCDAMAKDADVFVFVDSDVAATHEDFISLLESPKLDSQNAVCGCCLSPPGHLDAVPFGSRDITFGGEPRFAELLVAGLGFMAVHRDTIARLEVATETVRDRDGHSWRPYFMPLVLEYVESDGQLSREYLSDDYAFSWRLRGIGASVWLDTHIRVGRQTQSFLKPAGTMSLGPTIGAAARMRLSKP